MHVVIVLQEKVTGISHQFGLFLNIEVEHLVYMQCYWMAD